MFLGLFVFLILIMSIFIFILIYIFDLNILCYIYYGGQYQSCFFCLLYFFYLYLVDVKDKNV